jgi:hypothetical protein
MDAGENGAAVETSIGCLRQAGNAERPRDARAFLLSENFSVTPAGFEPALPP